MSTCILERLLTGPLSDATAPRRGSCNPSRYTSMSTFHYSQFEPVSTLVEHKHRLGETVSVVIPALNEAPTIGRIVSCIRGELVERQPLVDHIVVIDGDSTDATATEAARAGATVHAARDLGPLCDVPDGKGTSMWKALSVIDGSIVAYIDADIIEFGPHFVYGLIGPLLEHPAYQWSKAFYDRPLQQGGERIEGHGGRVTEILVRPLLSAWYPDAATIRQPLSGECAFRTKALKTLPFSSGYGVELQLLLGMYRGYGMSACAQVDMDVRRHRNRPVSQLSRMSLAILQTFVRFLEADKRISLLAPLADTWIGGGPGERVSIREVVLPPHEGAARGPAETP